MAEEALDVEIKRLLEEHRGKWQEISDGSGVSHSWISQFCRGLIPKPSYDSLKKVKDYFEPPPPVRAAKKPVAKVVKLVLAKKSKAKRLRRA